MFDIAHDMTQGAGGPPSGPVDSLSPTMGRNRSGSMLQKELYLMTQSIDEQLHQQQLPLVRPGLAKAKFVALAVASREQTVAEGKHVSFDSPVQFSPPKTKYTGPVTKIELPSAAEIARGQGSSGRAGAAQSTPNMWGVVRGTLMVRSKLIDIKRKKSGVSVVVDLLLELLRVDRQLQYRVDNMLVVK